MKIQEQSALREVLGTVDIPKMLTVRQRFKRDGIADVSSCLREKLMREDLMRRIQPGMKVVLTGSSRQLHVHRGP